MKRSLPEGCPPHCLWGQVDHARRIADGWWSVSTPSHGGYIVSRERLAKMPEYMRGTSYSRGGQFEEDCDWCMPVVVFPGEYATFYQSNADYFPAGTDPVEVAWMTFKRWHPEAHSKFTNETAIIDMTTCGVTYNSAACAAAR